MNEVSRTPIMQIIETASQGLKRTFEVTILATEIEKKLNTQLENMGKKVKLPGFRPGKVPLPLLKQRYKSEALSKVVEELIEKGVDQLVKDNSLKPALKPKVNLKSFEEGKDLAFEVNLEVLPTIGDINLDGLSFEKYVVTVPKEEVSRVLDKIASRNSKTQPLKKSRKTQKGDIAIIDFEGFVGKDPIEGGAGKSHPLELGSGSFIPGFEDQLIGHEKGAKVEVKVTFPKEYHEVRYANKPARFNVTINDIHEVEPAIIDAALAEKLGFESVDALKEGVERSLVKDYEGKSFLNVKRHILDALADRFSFPVPQTMVDMEFENIWEQLCHELGVEHTHSSNPDVKCKVSSKSFEEAAGKKEEDLREEYKAIAERRVRLGILLAEIGNRNNISVSNQELLNALMARAREFPGQEKEVYDFYRNNQSAMASLRAPLFENKVVEFILTKAKVKEKAITPEELEKILIREEKEAEKSISEAVKKSKKPSKKKGE